MKDNEIIELLNECDVSHIKIQCVESILSDNRGTTHFDLSRIVDLINRQKAEIERKEKEFEAFAKWDKEYQDEIYELRKSLLSRENLEESFSRAVKQFDKKLAKTVKLERAKAVKECIEKIKSKADKSVMTDNGIPVAGSATYWISEVTLYEIEKEMAGE